MTTTSHIVAGTRVMYARAFLRNIGAFTGPTPFREGTVLSRNMGVPRRLPATARVQWDDGASGTVLVVNLVAKSRRHLEAQ
jgi:hypothetical protein